MTLKEIGYLLTVAQCASISEAAKQLYVAQPSLTHAIQAVEREVGFRIFERGRSGVTVTEQGEELIRDIRPVYERMAIVQSKYVEKRPERKVFSVSLQHFSPVGEAFHRFLQGLDEPFYSVKILESTTSDVIADVAAGRSEIGFLHFSGENEPVILKDIRNEKLEFYSIRHVEPCLLLRWDHPLAAWDTISRAALDDYPLIAYDGGTDGTVYSSEDYSAPLQADRQIVVSDGLQMLDLLRTTNACAIGLSGQYALVRESGVVTRPLADVKPLRLGWIKKADTVLQPLAKRYLRMLNPE